ncbi:hypothetical protein LCGC14_0259720 [marine sediment metagenome]|jgi:hypothetical protein|uniref:Uncharacterized protein n=1 Tax=marine sediment metagenome TaxID=412755 RepID=A0A0F9U251_9ZZZZ
MRNAFKTSMFEISNMLCAATRSGNTPDEKNSSEENRRDKEVSGLQSCRPLKGVLGGGFALKEFGWRALTFFQKACHALQAS